MQLLRWLALNGSVTRGPAIFYDPVDPFQGRLHEYTFGTTLQPNPHSSANRLLTDLLGSYEFVPGAVFHAGYGSLYEKPLPLSPAGAPNPLGEQYLLVNRGLFFNSYLHRF